MNLTTMPFAKRVMSFAEQLIPGCREQGPPPPPAIPGHLIDINEATEFLRSESEKLGFTYAPPVGVLLEFCRFSSPTFFGSMTKITISRHPHPPAVCFERAGLLALVVRESQRRAALPPALITVSGAPPKVSACEKLARMESLERARTTPAEIFARQNREWLREQAAKEAMDAQR